MDNSLIFKMLIGAALVYGGVAVWNTLYGPDADKVKAKAINDGRYYTTECKPVEVNIDNGFLSANTNKLNCNNVIENVSTEYYDRTIRIYKNSKL